MATTNMTSSQAQNYIINPLTAPDPSDETGLNSHFRSTFAPKTPSANSSATEVSNISNGSASPPIAHHNKRHSRGALPPTPNSPPLAKGTRSRGHSLSHPNSPPLATGNRSRGNSLSQRYPGDMSHRPLDMIKKDSKTAHRSHHLRRASIPGVDTIDSLDTTPGGRYHHEGPFDATLASRNTNSMYSPVAAVAESNYEALKATPAENIKDAVERHRPLDGVAAVPPGMQDRYGRTYEYEETNLMTDGPSGDYKQFTGDALKSDQRTEIERDQNYEVGNHKNGQTPAIEMQEHHHRPKKSVEIQENEIDDAEGSSKRHSLEGLKKRIGSLRRRKD